MIRTLMAASVATLICSAGLAQEADTSELTLAGYDTSVTLAVGIASDYQYRGITRSNNEPSLQGSLDIEVANVYGSISAASTDLGNLDTLWQSEQVPVDTRRIIDGTEVVLEGGVKWQLLENLDLKTGVTYHYYAEEEGYVEFHVRPTYSLTDGLDIRGEVAVTPSFIADIDEGFYTGVGADLNVFNTQEFDLTLNVDAGYQTFERELDGGTQTEDYWHYGAGARLSGPLGLFIDGQYVDTAEAGRFNDFESDNAVFMIGFSVDLS